MKSGVWAKWENHQSGNISDTVAAIVVWENILKPCKHPFCFRRPEI
jgi:hypothetical protein